MSSIVLKPLAHQTETIENLNQQFLEKHNKALVILPSGSGKTHTIAFHVNQLKPKTFLYIVHQNAILTQTVKIFRDICKLSNRDIGIINQKNKDFDKPYLFATIQTLSNKKNLEKIRKDIEYMVIDEYHHVAADTYDRIITKHFKPKYLLGLTATPYRLDKKDIMKFVDGNIANNIDLFEGIERNILAPFHYIGLWDNIDYSEIRWSGYKYNIGDLDRKLIIHDRDKEVLIEYENRILSENRITIAFCNSVDHVNRITKKFKKSGIKAVGITYKEKPEVVQDILSDFRKGVYQILFTRDMLNEGVDFPECSAVMLLRPTISKTIFFQQIGRGLRKMQGKKNVLVLDYIGNYSRAFKKKNWLKMFKKKDETTGENIKPYYEYHPDIKIYFDEKVVEMMDIQERNYRDNPPPNSRFTTNKQELIDNYYRVKKHWDLISDETEKKEVNKFYTFSGNNIPPKRLLYDQSVSKYSEWAYYRMWGNFVNFLEEIGEVEIKDTTITRWDSEELVIKKLNIMAKRLQEKLGRKFFNFTDWFNEYKTNGITPMASKFGGFIKFKEKFGYTLEWERTCPVCNKITISKKGLKKNSSMTCSNHCSHIFFNRTPEKRAKLKASREEKRKIMAPCKYCEKLIHTYVYNPNSDSMVRYLFCSRLCKQRYHITDGKKRPLMTNEEKIAKRNAATKERWRKYREEKKSKNK